VGGSRSFTDGQFETFNSQRRKNRSALVYDQALGGGVANKCGLAVLVDSRIGYGH